MFKSFARRFSGSRSLLLILIPFVLVAYQNCGDFVTLDASKLASGAGASGAAPFVLESDPVLKDQATAILQTKCAACHQTSNLGNVTKILDPVHLVSTGLVTPGDPTKGRLIGSIEGGTMPPAPQVVTPQELTILRNWISSIRVVGTAPPVAGGAPLIPAGMTVGSDAILKPQALRVLQVNCAGCHQSDNEGGISRIMETDRLVTSGLVTIGNPNQGRLMGSILDGSMPARGSRLTVSPQDRQILSNWITSMRLVAIDPAAPVVSPLPALAPTFQSINQNILIPKCVGCHGAARADGGERYDSYVATMRSVTANNANNSKLYTESQNGNMPDRPFVQLSAVELTAIQTWINTGALNN